MMATRPVIAATTNASAFISAGAWPQPLPYVVYSSPPTSCTTTNLGADCTTRRPVSMSYTRSRNSGSASPHRPEYYTNSSFINVETYGTDATTCIITVSGPMRAELPTITTRFEYTTHSYEAFTLTS